MLEHIPHFDVEVADFAIVLFVEGGGPVDAEDEIVVHSHLEAAAAREMRLVKALVAEETVVCSGAELVRIRYYIIVWLHHHSSINEWIETYIKHIFPNLKAEKLCA